jgi:hypothetical protein
MVNKSMKQSMFNILSHKGSANQNYTKIPFHPIRMAITREQTTNGEDVGRKGTLIHCWWEFKLVKPLWKSVWRFLIKLKIVLPYDPVRLLLAYVK